MKLRKLHIEDYKMFKDFDISFVDEHDEALPIIVLAGVNGSGKTSLLEYILDYEWYITHNFSEIDNTFVEIIDNAGIISLDYEILRPDAEIYLQNLDFYTKHLLYMATYTSIENIKDFLPKYIETKVYEEGLTPFDAYRNVREYINIIFKDLNIQIEFTSRDREGNLFFRNKFYSEKFLIDELSTGEKTLMSKVLYLYLEDIKNKVILIDEPELSLHPSWQNKVLKIYEKFAKKNNCQIIMATHSPHIIGSAKPEYIRLLKKENNKIVAIDNIDRSYGLEFDKVLTDIMGVEYLRTPEIAKDIKRLWELLENENYESEEYKTLYKKLEDILGNLDKDLVLARLEIAKIKSRNAKAK